MLRLFKKRYRQLTNNEIEMLKLIFSDSIEYDKVKIFKDKYLPFQNKNIAMSPNGNIYFDEKHHQDDFSISSNSNKMWFIHEMTHVWQYQNGLNIINNAFGVLFRGGYKNKSAYCYDHECKSDEFCSLNFEQQATIIEDYFAAKYLNISKYIERLPYLENILKDFLKNPKDKNLISSI